MNLNISYINKTISLLLATFLIVNPSILFTMNGNNLSVNSDKENISMSFEEKNPSLVVNPGFEEGEDSPTGWNFIHSYGGTWEWDSETKFQGDKSVKLSITDETRAILDQTNIPVQGGTTYELSGWYLTDIGKIASIHLYWYGEKDNADYIDFKMYNNTAMTDEWEEMRYEVVAPENAKYARLMLYVLGVPRNVWYDNIDFREIVLEKIDLKLSDQKLIVGQSTVLEVIGTMSNGKVADLTGEDANIVFSSDDEEVVTVDDEGRITAIGVGNANITVTATLNGISSQSSIEIMVLDELLEKIMITSEKTELVVDTQTQLKVKGLTLEGTEIELQEVEKHFQSSNEDIATVDENGIVTAKGIGTVIITVSVNWGNEIKTGTIEMEVVKPGLERIVLTSSKTELFPGNTAQLSITGVLDNGSTTDFTGEDALIVYTSDNESVAVVDADGIVSAVGSGIAKIIGVVVLQNSNITKEDAIELKVVNPEDIVSAKTKSTYYTESKVSNARENVNKYHWAKSLRDTAVFEADKYLMDDDFLWNIVTPPTVPRAIYHIRRPKAIDLGCPVCGQNINKHGNYPWKIDHINKPWKLECPECNTVFPTNDFDSYYKSGLDNRGVFIPEKADKKYLKNELYPEKGEAWGVDDGFGWKNGDDVWTFIAYYNHHALWYRGFIHNALKAFRDAYLYTGDVKYARAGIILLDRIADFYPDMDVTDFPWEAGFDNGVPGSHTAQGKILHDIWEAFLLTDFVSAYDAFFPILEDGDVGNVVPFLSEKADQYDIGVLKYSVEGIRKNIEDNLVRQVFPAFKNSQIRGNFGMHQATLAMAAVVLDEEGTTQEMIDYNFQTGKLDMIIGSEYPYGRKYIVTGGNILTTLVDYVDRDGFGNEAAPGYNNLWLSQIGVVADVLDGYERYSGADLYENVKFRKMFQANYPLIMLGEYIPSIGDSGACGQPGLIVGIDTFIKAFEKFGDPVYAQLAYMLNDNSTIGIHGDIFSEDPDEMPQTIKKIIETYGPLNLESMNLSGYGLATLRDGKDYRQKTGQEYNFLNLPVLDSSGKGHKKIGFPALFYRSEGIDDYITFEFEVHEEGEYEIGIKTLLYEYGKYIIKVDGKQMGEEYDLYSPEVKESELIKLGNCFLEEGKHTITLECKGKNEASPFYHIGLRYLVLLDKDAKKIEETNQILGNKQRDIWMYYGRNTGHGHKDTLNIGIHAYGLNLAPDLGYPEDTGINPDRFEWTNNTISHNTVVVDREKQSDQWVGIPKNFDETEMVKLMDVEAPLVYTQTDMYKRTTAMIKVDDEHSYMVDFFRVKGGDEHHFSFHSNEAIVTTEGLNLVEQSSGTYAGANVPYKQRPKNDSVDGAGYKGPGFHYLYNVEKDNNPPNTFSVDWQQTKDKDVHLRLTMVGDTNHVALADGDPPQNKAGNPRRLKYLIAQREGKDLNSLFTSVIEPYKGERYIEAIEEVLVTSDGENADADVKAIKITLKDGRIDYIVSALDKEKLYTVDEKFDFKGYFGVYSEKDGKPLYSYLNDGTTIGEESDRRESIDGTVTGFTKDLSIENQITISTTDDIKPDEVIDRYIYIENDNIRNAVYKIKGLQLLGDGKYKVDIGDTTLIRHFADADNFNKGYVYDMEEGARFTIPLSYTVKYDAENPGETEEPTDPGETEEPTDPGETGGLTDSEDQRSSNKGALPKTGQSKKGYCYIVGTWLAAIGALLVRRTKK